MNEIIRAMKTRRSIRRFKPDMPAKADIDAVIEAGLYAASGMGKQGVITVAFTGDKLKKLVEANRAVGGWEGDYNPFYGAPVVLMVLANKNNVTHVYDGSLVIGNMLLAAHSLGLGSIWIHRAKEESEMPEYKELLKSLGVEGEWEGIGHCALGYADCELPEAPERKENRVYWAE